MTEWRVAAGLIGMFAVSVACDPGIRISQAPLPGAANATGVFISIKTSYPLIGRKWYSPETTVTNSSQQAITVTSVELRTPRVEYANKRVGGYPVTVPPRATVALDMWFEFHDEIRSVFEEPAELRVHYRSGEKNEIAQAGIVGGSSQ